MILGIRVPFAQFTAWTIQESNGRLIFLLKLLGCMKQLDSESAPALLFANAERVPQTNGPAF